MVILVSLRDGHYVKDHHGKGSAVRSSAELPRPKRGAPDQTRERIIAAAAKQFNHSGYRGTDSNSIAKEAGYATGTFYKHFRDKREGFLCVYERWLGAEWKEVDKELSRRGKAEETARQLVALSVKFHSEWRGLRASLMELIFSDLEARKFFGKQRRRQLDLMADLRSRFVLPPRTKEQDALHLFLTERVFDPIGQGEIQSLGLDHDVIVKSMVETSAGSVRVKRLLTFSADASFLFQDRHVHSSLNCSDALTRTRMESSMKMLGRVSAVLGLLILATGSAQSPTLKSDPDALVRLNQIQVIGSHNSYHAGLLPAIAQLLQRQNPEAFKGLDYSHAGLAAQLDHGIRQIELDIFADTKGGLYAHPFGPKLVAHADLPADPNPYPHGVMLKPGFKVMHIQDIDYASNCQPFTACLQIVRAWSNAHPGHAPIFILVETKREVPDDKNIPWTVPEPWSPSVFDALDAEIRIVFSKDEMITPDQVRGHHRALNQGILYDGWPTLAQARGKVVFLMDQQWAGPIYLKGHPSLRDRILFTNATPGNPDAAFVEANDASTAEIDRLVRKGYLVRTRADADTVEARSNDTRRRDEVLDSGAQMISTDYPAFEPSRWTSYFVALPSGLPARCNPVTAPKDCVSSRLELSSTP
jgi:AcrR family transcriptional regulator